MVVDGNHELRYWALGDWILEFSRAWLVSCELGKNQWLESNLGAIRFGSWERFEHSPCNAESA